MAQPFLMKLTAVDAAVIKVIGSMRRSLNRRKYFRVKKNPPGFKLAGFRV